MVQETWNAAINVNRNPPDKTKQVEKQKRDQLQTKMLPLAADQQMSILRSLAAQLGVFPQTLPPLPLILNLRTLVE